MSSSAASTTFFREIDRNRRNSWLLVGVVIVVLGVLGGAIGYATGFGWVGRHRGGGHCHGNEPRLLLRGRQAGPRLVGGQGGPGRQPAGPVQAARQRGHRDEPRLRHTHAPRLRHRRHRAKRLRDRPRPEARLDRGDHRAAGEDGSRGAPGRHWARDEPRPQLRHPLHAAGRGPGRLHRAALRLVPALHVLVRRRAPSQQLGSRQRRGGEGSRPSCSSWPSCSPSWLRSSVA